MPPSPSLSLLNFFFFGTFYFDLIFCTESCYLSQEESEESVGAELAQFHSTERRRWRMEANEEEEEEEAEENEVDVSGFEGEACLCGLRPARAFELYIVLNLPKGASSY